jgi:hypothetical protein
MKLFESLEEIFEFKSDDIEIKHYFPTEYHEMQKLKDTLSFVNIPTLLNMLDSLDNYLSKESKITAASNVRRMKQYLQKMYETLAGEK